MSISKCKNKFPYSKNLRYRIFKIEEFFRIEGNLTGRISNVFLFYLLFKGIIHILASIGTTPGAATDNNGGFA